MNIVLLMRALNKYAAHSMLNQHKEKQLAADVVWSLWKNASGVSEQLQQNLTEDKLRGNVDKMNRVSKEIQERRANILNPQLYTETPINTQLSLNNQLAKTLVADDMVQKLSPKFGMAKEAQVLNAVRGADLLLKKIGKCIKLS